MVAPAADVEALHIFGARGAVRGVWRLSDEEIDDVRAPLVDDRADGPPIDIIEPSADQREAKRRQVDHRRRYVEPPVEPRFDRVLVGGEHVGQMPRLQRSQMRRDDFRGETLLVVGAQHDRDDAGRRHCGDGGAHGETCKQRAAAGAARLWHCRLDPLAQVRRRGEAHVLGSNGCLHITVGPECGRAACAGGDMVFDLARVTGIEFAVDQRVQKDV